MAVVIVGLFAEWRWTGFAEPSVWLPDLTVGVLLAVLGVGLRAREAERVGSLVVLAGLAWFAGNFASEPTGWIAWSADHLALVHRAFIVAALVMFPSGRTRDRVERVVIIAAFAGAVLPAVARDEWWTIAWASGLLVLFGFSMCRRSALLRAGGYLVLPVMATFWTVLVTTAAMRLILGDTPAPRVEILVYQAGVIATSAFLLNRAAEWRRRTLDVADAVVEVTFGPAGNVRDLLSQALRDPTVEIVFAVERDGTVSWVDEAGGPAARSSRDGRAVVPIVVDGRPVAEVASTVDFEALPGLLTAVASATRLAADHARLRADLRREIDVLAASRRRLLSAADRERGALAAQLEREAGKTLEQIRELLEGVGCGRDEALDEAVRRSRQRLEGVENDFESLAAGLGPAALMTGGLGEALGQLVDGGTVRVTLEVDGRIDAVPPAAASTIYFVCAEGIANAVKHASATGIGVVLASNASGCVLQVIDNGCGGAAATSGSGLQRLADRVGALGGTLAVDSPVGAGTRLTVELPCG